MIAVIYAGQNEWHQSFIPLRDAEVRDVAIDALGAVLARLSSGSMQNGDRTLPCRPNFPRTLLSNKRWQRS